VKRQPLRTGTERALVREALHGWRAWRVVERRDGPTLTSWWLDALWPARRALESACGMHGPRPVAHHMCGIHAYAAREAAFAYLGRRHEGPPSPFARRPERTLGVAFGRVSGWGHAVQHTHGWRSQFAYPYELFLIGGDRDLAVALASRYAVDTVLGPPDR
jgi:hypothetical protein